jgi:hypothetical protein
MSSAVRRNFDASALNIIPDANGNLVGSTTTKKLDPLIGALADNKGPTKTIALLDGSPAINAGDNAASPGSTDQRGPGFDRIVGGFIDIGAFEFKPIHAGRK